MAKLFGKTLYSALYKKGLRISGKEKLFDTELSELIYVDVGRRIDSKVIGSLRNNDTKPRKTMAIYYALFLGVPADNIETSKKAARFKVICANCKKEFLAGAPWTKTCSPQCKKGYLSTKNSRYYWTNKEFRLKAIENAKKWNAENHECVLANNQKSRLKKKEGHVRSEFAKGRNTAKKFSVPANHFTV